MNFQHRTKMLFINVWSYQILRFIIYDFKLHKEMLNLQLHRSVARYILANLTKKMWLYMQIEKAPYALYLYIE